MIRYIGLLRDWRVWVMLLLAFVIRGGASWYLDVRMAEETEAQRARIAAMTPRERAAQEAEAAEHLGSMLGVDLPVDPTFYLPPDAPPEAEATQASATPTIAPAPTSSAERARATLAWVPLVAGGLVFLAVLGVGGAIAWRLTREEPEADDEPSDEPAPPA